MRRYASVVTISTALVGTLVLGAAASYAVNTDLTEHGAAQRIDGDQTQSLREEPVKGPAKNVILLIGDGMGDSEITLARNYAYGAAGRFPGIDALPLTGQYTTYALDQQTASRPRHRLGGLGHGVGDRHEDLQRRDLASTSTGRRTDARSRSRRRTACGTGDVSTAELQDATPAVQVAHVAARSCYGPDVTSHEVPDGRAGERRLGLDHASRLLGTRADVIARRRGRRAFGETAKAGAWNGQDAARAGQGARLPGRHRSDELDGVTRADAGAAACSACSPPGTCRSAGPVRRPRCTAVPTSRRSPARRNPTRPAAADARRHDQQGDRPAERADESKGFFLQVEGASIDKQDHAADPVRPDRRDGRPRRGRAGRAGRSPRATATRW